MPGNRICGTTDCGVLMRTALYLQFNENAVLKTVVKANILYCMMYYATNKNDDPYMIETNLSKTLVLVSFFRDSIHRHKFLNYVKKEIIKFLVNIYFPKIFDLSDD